jgi:predicted dehydrogenase
MPTLRRIGIVGLDHWYIGREVPAVAARRDDATVVAIAHHHVTNRQELVARWSIPHQTDDLMAVATHPDVDVVVTACATSEHVELALAAARHGKHLVTVKPCAMTIADAERLRDGVDASGVLAVPFEAHTRFQPHGRTFARLIREGAIGTPLSATLVGRFAVDGARLDWPGQPNPNAWWMDPSKSPGGGWIDHAIYLVDWLEWALGDRVVRASGVTKTLVHHDLHPEKEDFGVALLEFSRGAVATVEVTWSSPRDHYLMAWQVTGTEGDLVWDGTISPGMSIRAKHGTAEAAKWHPLAADGADTASMVPSTSGFDLPVEARRPAMATSCLDHLLDCLATGSKPIATLADSVHTLRACNAFYQAARTGRVVDV